MLRTVLAPLAMIAVACGSSSKNEPAGAGPAFSPVIANELRAIASNCKLERQGGVERRDCTGAYGIVQITTAGGKLSALTIALPSKILPEAKGHFGSALQGTLGPKGVEELLAKLATLETGQAADLTIGAAKVHLAAGGKSTLAPEYTAELKW